MSARRLPWWLAAGVALLRRPDLWPVAVAEASRLAAARWWRRWPPLPRPPARWLAFRMETAYGDEAARPDPPDVIAWLEWCRSMRRGRQTVR